MSTDASPGRRRRPTLDNPAIGSQRVVQADEEQSRRVADLEDYFDAKLSAPAEERVNMRWDARSLAVVRRAAALAGVPYQTYVKQTVFRQALSDLRDAAAAGIVSEPGR
jgi:predicted DNA binding CopG/RHH family protein